VLGVGDKLRFSGGVPAGRSRGSKRRRVQHSFDFRVLGRIREEGGNERERTHSFLRETGPRAKRGEREGGIKFV